MPLGFGKKNKQEGKKNKKKKPVWREWLDAALFAIIAATLIRTFIMEAYTIPTGSMEGTLLVKDYLWVNKMSYGARIPMTPLSLPLMHNTLPVLGTKSYSDAVQWKYRRLPGFGDVERNDVVVFNFPVGDTVSLEYQSEKDYYSILRENNNNRDLVWRTNTIVTRPVDKKENFIKRCVAIPGDQVEARDGQLYINGQLGEVFPHVKMTYYAQVNTFLSEEFLEENDIDVYGQQGNNYMLNIPNDALPALKNNPSFLKLEPNVIPKGMVGGPSDWAFPQDTTYYKWNRDNFGPLTVPKAGTTVTLTPENIALYRRIIRNYEGHQLEERNGQFIIDGQVANTYTFAMDYYWMMGDNRHNSADSRYWGFVPMDHVVGKAAFVWLSFNEKGGIRWKRLLRGIKHLER